MENAEMSQPALSTVGKSSKTREEYGILSQA